MKKIFIPIPFVCLILFSECENKNLSDPKSSLEGLTKLVEGYITGASVKAEIWSKTSFIAGYNKLTIVLYDSINPGRNLTDAHIYFIPELTIHKGLAARYYSAPVENPPGEALSGVFTAAIVFTVHSSADKSWKLHMGIHDHTTDKEGEAIFGITVNQPIDARIISFTSGTSDSSRLLIAVVKPQDPKLGMNDFELTLHLVESDLYFTPSDSYSIKIEPLMPSTGPITSGYQDPVSVGNGHYKGKINFTVTGKWRLNLTIMKENKVVSDGTFFEFNL